MTESFFTTLKTAAESVGVSVTDNQCEKLYKFYETVVEYNKNVNLTAITDEKEFIVKHIVDSISAAKFIKENAAVVDIGAGAGFPSIPLKIIRDDIVLIMLDALSKRVDFLNFAVSELSLKNAKAKHLRAEEAGEKLLRGSADVVVARAVGQTNILLELSIPLLKKHGVFINYKGIRRCKLDVACLGCIISVLFQLDCDHNIHSIVFCIFFDGVRFQGNLHVCIKKHLSIWKCSCDNELKGFLVLLVIFQYFQK